MALSGVCTVAPELCGVSSVGAGLANSFFGGATGWIASSSAWVWHGLGAFLSATSSTAVVTDAARPEYNVLLRVAPLVALCAFLANVLTGLRHGDSAHLARDVLWATPVLIFAAITAVPLAGVVLDVVNALSSAAAGSATTFLSTLGTTAGTYPSTVPGFAQMLLDLAGVVGALLLWFELVVRNAVLALLVCLAPIIAAAALWAPLRRLAVRLVETFVAVALSKFVIVVALSLGASAAAPLKGEVALTGIAVVALAVLVPFSLLRVVPLLEASALHALEGTRQRATSGARRVAGTATNAALSLTPLPPPGPPERPADLGLPMWPGGPEPTFPEPPDEPPVPPVGTPTVRRGHVAYLRDRFGPVIGWHFDE